MTQNAACYTKEDCIKHCNNKVHTSGSVGQFLIVLNVFSNVQIDNKAIVKRLEIHERHFDLHVDGTQVDLKC